MMAALPARALMDNNDPPPYTCIPNQRSRTSCIGGLRDVHEPRAAPGFPGGASHGLLLLLNNTTDIHFVWL